jgi:hypothetical protein
MNKFNPASALAFIPPTLTDHMRAEKKRFSLKKTLIASIMILGAAAMFSVNASAEKHAPKSASMRPLQVEDFGPAASNEQGAMLLGQIEAKWSGVMRNIYGWSDGAFQQFRTGYRNSPVTVLENALAADTWEKMWKVFNDYAALKAQKGMAKAFPLGGTRPEDAFNPVVAEAKASAAKLLGDDARDLVFIPITPCTVWDTRFASDVNSAGIIGNGITRKFYTHINGAGGSFAPWGGNTSCPETAQNALGDRPYAVMMTVYVNNPAGNGWLTFYRDGDPDSSQATISTYYSPGPTRTQTVISKSSRGWGVGTYDVAVTGRYSSADASASITGYFMKAKGVTKLRWNHHAAVGTIPVNNINNPEWSFVGEVATVVLPAGGGQIRSSITSVIGLNSGGPVFLDYAICKRDAFLPFPLDAYDNYYTASVTTNPTPYNASMAEQLPQGTYYVGFCTRNYSGSTITNSDWSIGWTLTEF